MDNKITLSILAQLLSDRTGRSRKECEDLLRGFFHTISATLSKGEAVKVRGFGTFRISQVDARMSVDISSGHDFEIPAHNRIVFLPSKELAAAVNAPFSMFETIELAEDLSEVELQDVEKGDDTITVDIAEDDDRQRERVDAESTVSEKETETAPEEVPVAEDEPVAEYVSETIAEPIAETLLSEDSESVSDEGEQTFDENDEDSEEVYVNKKGRSFGHGFIWGMVASLFLILCGAIVYYFLNPDFATKVNGYMPGHKNTEVVAANRPVPDTELKSESESDTEMVELVSTEVSEQEIAGAEANESAEENPVPTKPSDEPVFDTIRPHTGLGVIARKHYGNYHFWPYIYKENEKILGHPDRITPGTRVVIPKLSKYGIDPKNKDDLAKAKRLDAEIYAKYRKH